MLIVTINGNCEPFQYFNFETNFLKNANPFQKKQECLFLAESNKIENAAFPYKIVLSEANMKINRTESTKWTYHKEQSFANKYF